MSYAPNLKQVAHMSLAISYMPQLLNGTLTIGCAPYLRISNL